MPLLSPRSISISTALISLQVQAGRIFLVAVVLSPTRNLENLGCTAEEKQLQVPPLRFAAVGMTVLHYDSLHYDSLHYDSLHWWIRRLSVHVG
jgi:hypothetical protein